MNQITFDFARDRMETGISRSALSSGSDWQDAAFQSVVEYASTHKQFLTEELRVAAHETLPEPKDGRSWGGVMQRAAREGIVRKVGYKAAKSSNLSPKPLWESMVWGRPNQKEMNYQRKDVA